MVPTFLVFQPLKKSNEDLFSKPDGNNCFEIILNDNPVVLCKICRIGNEFCRLFKTISSSRMATTFLAFQPLKSCELLSCMANNHFCVSQIVKKTPTIQHRRQGNVEFGDEVKVNADKTLSRCHVIYIEDSNVNLRIQTHCKVEEIFFKISRVTDMAILHTRNAKVIARLELNDFDLKKFQHEISQAKYEMHCIYCWSNIAYTPK